MPSARPSKPDPRRRDLPRPFDSRRAMVADLTSQFDPGTGRLGAASRAAESTSPTGEAPAPNHEPIGATA